MGCEEGSFELRIQKMDDLGILISNEFHFRNYDFYCEDVDNCDLKSEGIVLGNGFIESIDDGEFSDGLCESMSQI